MIGASLAQQNTGIDLRLLVLTACFAKTAGDLSLGDMMWQEVQAGVLALACPLEKCCSKSSHSCNESKSAENCCTDACLCRNSSAQTRRGVTDTLDAVMQ